MFQYLTAMKYAQQKKMKYLLRKVSTIQISTKRILMKKHLKDWQDGYITCYMRCTHCSNYKARGASGNYEARGASGGKYEAWMVIFCILAAVNRFSWISWKEESRWGKSESRWRKRKAVAAVNRFSWISWKEESRWGKSESRWRKRKAIEESGKPLKKVESQFWWIGFCTRKIGF